MLIWPILAQAAAALAGCADPQTQTEMNICAGREYEAADAALNAAWDEVAATAHARDRRAAVGGGDGTTFDRLLDGQRKWLAFRDAHCLSVAGLREEGGSIWPLVQASCLTGLTETRTAQLRVQSDEFDR